MSKTKYTMTDAAAKRITANLLEVWTPGLYLSIEMIEKALRKENFSGGYRHNYVKDLMEWMVENNHAHFSWRVAEVYVREYYNQREGINELISGLQRLDVIPYPPEED